MMIPSQNNLALQITKETVANIAKIAGLYLVTQTMQAKLKEITKNTSQLAAAGLRNIRSKYEEKF